MKKKVKTELYDTKVIISINNTTHKFVRYNYTKLSCGVDMLTTLPKRDTVTNWLNICSVEELTHIFRNFFEEICLTKTLDSHGDEYCNGVAHLLFSTNLESETIFTDILDKLCTSSSYKVNPNSGNKIKVWIYTKD